MVELRFMSPELVFAPVFVGLPCRGTALRGITSTRFTKLLISWAAISSALSGERKRDRARRGDAIVVEVPLSAGRENGQAFMSLLNYEYSVSGIVCAVHPGGSSACDSI